jgi:hypothetical protein
MQTRICPIHKNMPVIFITAHDDRANPEQALAGGALWDTMGRMGTSQSNPTVPAGTLAQGPISTNASF